MRPGGVQIAMPPLQPRSQWSARLQAILVGPMASTSGPPQRGGPKRPTANASTSGGSNLQTPATNLTGAKGKGPAVATEGSSGSTHPKNIQWDNSHTDKLVNWLLTHPANSRILFSNKNTADLPPLPTEQPLGHNKRDVQAIVSQAIFANDTEYQEMYAASPAKFQTSVGNRIATWVPLCWESKCLVITSTWLLRSLDTWCVWTLSLPCDSSYHMTGYQRVPTNRSHIAYLWRGHDKEIMFLLECSYGLI